MQSGSSRERLVDAAVDTISLSGFNGCGVRDIVDKAGVPKGSLYNYFRSKEALGCAAVQRYWEQYAIPQLGILTCASMPPDERIMAYLDDVRERFEARGFTGGCMIGNLSAELSDQSSAMAERLAMVFRVWTEVVDACVAEGQAAGTVRATLDPAATARFIVNALQGAILRAKVDKTATAFEDLIVAVRLVLSL